MTRSLEGKTVSSYVLTESIGEGGMGALYTCWLNPYVDLEQRLLAGELKERRSMAGITHDGELTDEDRKKILSVVEPLKRKFTEGLQNAQSNFERLGLYGDGSMLEYLAPHRKLEGELEHRVKFAVKVITKEQIENRLKSDPNFAERFEREASTLRSLKHKNIPAFVDSGHSDDLLYIVMEHVEKAPEQEKMSVTRATWIVQEALKALVHMHEKGFFHRDIKPENIILDKNLDVKVVDLGLAQPDDPKETRITSANIVVGTPLFIAPERYQRNDNEFVPFTKECDLYSLGATFYQYLTGRAPPNGTTAQDVALSLVKDAWIFVRKLNPAISLTLETLLMRMIDKEPKTRIEEHEALEEIKRILDKDLCEYSEPSKEQKKQIKSDIRKLKKNIAAARRSGNKAKIAELLEEIGDQYIPDAVGVQDRLDAYERALKYYKLHAEKQTGDFEQKAAAANIASIESKIAAEMRRLEDISTTRRKPFFIRNLWKFAAAAVTALAVGGYFGWQKYTASRNQAAYEGVVAKYAGIKTSGLNRDFVSAQSTLEEALKAELTESFKQKLEDNRVQTANELYAGMQQLLEKDEYSDASKLIELIKKLIDNAKPQEEKLKKDAEELRARIKEDEIRIAEVITDIAMYDGLMKLFEKIAPEYERLEAQLLKENKFIKHAEIDNLTDSVERIAGKLLHIHPKAKDKRADSVREMAAKVVSLKELLDTKQIEYLVGKAKQAEEQLNIGDYTVQGVDAKLKTAREILDSAKETCANVDPVRVDFRSVMERFSASESRHADLSSRVAEYSVWLKQAQEGSRDANVNLVKTYIGFGHLDKAEAHLNAVADKAGLDAYLTIINLEKRIPVEQVKKTALGLDAIVINDYSTALEAYNTGEIQADKLIEALNFIASKASLEIGTLVVDMRSGDPVKYQAVYEGLNKIVDDAKAVLERDGKLEFNEKLVAQLAEEYRAAGYNAKADTVVSRFSNN